MRTNKKLSKVLSLVLAFAMVFGMMIPAMAAQNSKGGLKPNGQVGNFGHSFDRTAFNNRVNPNEKVRVSIVLEKASTIAAGYSTVDIAENAGAMKYRDTLRAQQAEVQNKIERKLGKELDVVWNLTLAANIISANVRRGDIEAIEAVDGVKSVYVEKQYAPDVISIGGKNEPNMAISGEIDGAHAAWEAGYTGEGTLIAIIDTGLDTDHQSFDNGAFLAAVDEANLKLTEADVLAKAEDLNAVKTERATANQLYRSEKVPFGWNYIDSSADITHDNDTQGEHGSHVAGIAAANRLVKVNGEYVDALEAVQVAGNAPDAQFLIMKVFGKGGGAYDSDCVAAIEDAIILGADAVNLSLGMALPGFATPPAANDPYADIQETMVNSDTVVVYSAGNAGSWAENTYWGYLYNDGMHYQLGGESGSYTNSFTVASVDNSGFIGATANANGVEFGWTDGSLGREFRTLDTTGEGTDYKFIMVNPASAGNDAAIVAALAGEIDANTIYITWRGTTSFFEKGNAGVGAGAAGVLVANNQPGTISMDLTGYYYQNPVASMLQSDGLAIWNTVEEKKDVPGTSYQYITGTITVDGTVGAHAYANEYYTVSDFSSWGTTGDLALKPEISAFGGNIYSVNGLDKSGTAYELMSGTSMAAPQITGMSALVQQYLRANGIKSDATARALTQGLLMAAAVPMKDADGNYYSLLQQGAGLANVNNAITSPVYITVDGQNDGKVKAELGDDFNRTGVYTVSFDIHNLTGKAYTYKLDADAFTQAYFAEAGYGEFLDYATRALDAEVSFAIDDDLFVYEGREYDFDGDNDQDKDDAQLLLDHIILGTEIKHNADKMDVNGDGVVDTYDVYVLLNDMKPAVVVGGKDTVHVEATITLTDAEKALLDEQNPAGAYVEAFITVEPVADEEGVLAPELSIPVLAYYGSWTDASMFEIGTNTEWWDAYEEGSYEVGGRYPYTADFIFDGQGNQGLTNILVEDDSYVHLDGESIGSQVGSLAYWYTQIRNAGNGVAQVTYTDAEGKEVLAWRSADLGAEYGVTYYENAGMWLRPSLTGSLYYSLFNEVDIDWAAALKNIPADATEITVSLIKAPEYYAQYGYDWDALTDGDPANGELGAGAYLSTHFVIDPEPPVIVSVEADDDNTPYTITVTAKDNVSVTDITLWDSEGGLVHEFNPTIVDENYEPNFEASKPNEETTVVFDGYYTLDFFEYLFNGVAMLVYDSPLTPDLYTVEVTDTAGNVTSQDILVGMKPTETADSIELSDEEISLLKGSTYQLTAVVGPVNLTDKSVTWTSSNEAVATVDAETGVVTAVSVGTATITATTNASPNLTATVDVEVFTLPITANGILGDENGYAKYFKWNFEEGTLDYSDASASEVEYPLAITEYVNDTFLLIDTDYAIYQLDRDGNEYNYAAGTYYTQFHPFDISYSENAGFWWTDGDYVMTEDDPFNPTTMGWAIGTNYGATYGNPYAVAVVDNDWDNGTNSGDHEAWVLTDGGYMMRMRPYETAQGTSASLTFFPLGFDTSWVGYQGDTYGNMVIGNDGLFYVSIMTGDTNEVYAIELTLEEGSTSFYRTISYLGDFGDDVWPALFLNVKKNIPEGQASEYDFNEDGVVDVKDVQAILTAVVRENAKNTMDVNADGKVSTRDAYELLKKIDAGEFGSTGNALKAETAVSVTVDMKQSSTQSDNTLNAAQNFKLDSAVKVEKKASASRPSSVEPGNTDVNQGTHTVTVPVKASDVENGLVSLKYDESVLTYASYTAASGAYTQVYNKNGVVRIGFAGLDKLSGDTVAEITFTYEAKGEDRVSEITVSVIEDGATYNENPTAKKVEVKLAGEELDSYVLTGVITDENFNVHQFTWDTANSIKYDRDLNSLLMPVVAASINDNEYYVVDYDYITDGYDMHLVNKTTGAVSESVYGWGEAGVDVIPWDMAYGGTDFYNMWGVYGYYIFTDLGTDEPMADQQLSAWNFQSYGMPYFLGIDVVEGAWTANGYSGDKYIIAIDDSGYVWKLMPYDTLDGTSASFQRIPYDGMPDLYMDIEWATEDATGTSLVVDENGVIYFSYIDPNTEATAIYRLTLEGSTYVGEQIAETDYWAYPALLLGVGANAAADDDAPFKGMLSDNGNGKFFTWDGETTITGDTDVAPSGITKTVNNDGYYVISETDGMLYKLDNNGKKVGSATNVNDAVWDVAETRVGIFGIYGTYLISPFQPDTFAMSGFDLTQFDSYIYYFSAITAAEQPWTVETTSGLTYEGDIMLYLLDDYGWVWPIYVREEGGEFAGIIVGEYSNDLYTQLRVEPEPYGGSTLVVGDENTLYASMLVGNTSKLYQIDMDHDEYDCTTTELGNLGYKGLITEANMSAMNTAKSVNNVSGNVKVLDTTAAVNVKEFKDVVKTAPMALKGGLNSVEVTEADDTANGVVVDKDAQTVTVPVHVTNSTNGEFVLAYDNDALTLDLTNTLGGDVLTSVKVENGEIHVGYAGQTPVNGNVLTAVFTYDGDSVDTTSITLKVMQDGTVKETVTTEVEIDLSEDVELNLGDVNLDGEITAEDARLALRRAVDLEDFAKDSAQYLNADVNFDGEVTAEDARSILRAAVDLEDPADWLANKPE